MIKNKISILVVDDELDICEMVAETLKDEDYNAIVATNYDMAVDILKNENVNLLYMFQGATAMQMNRGASEIPSYTYFNK